MGATAGRKRLTTPRHVAPGSARGPTLRRRCRAGALRLAAIAICSTLLVATPALAAGPELSRSQCPASRSPVPVEDPRLTRFWTAAASFDRTRHGFSVLPVTGEVVFEHHPDAGSAVIHTCQGADRVYRTVHFRLAGDSPRWIGEQQSFRSGRTFEDKEAGTLLEELILDYETEPVAGFPLNRLNILYRGPPSARPGWAVSPSRDQARRMLRRWGF